MGNENPDNNKPDSNLTPKEGEQINEPKKGEKGSSDTTPPNNNESGYRKQQARADKAESELEHVHERLETLEEIQMQQAKDADVKAFLGENSKKYPDVTAEDLDRFAQSPDEIEEIAKHLQAKADALRQSTLAESRDVPDDKITEEEYKKETAKLIDDISDPNRFNRWFSLKSKVRK